MISNLIKQKLLLLNSLKFGSIDTDKEKEMIVWVRLQPYLDKPELIDFIQKKFHLDEQYAESLYYKAYPDGLSRSDFERVRNLDEVVVHKQIPLQNVDEMTSHLIKTDPHLTVESLLDYIESYLKSL